MMKKDDGMSIIGLIFLVIIVIGIIGTAGYFLFGENGIYRRVTESETEYNKEEIVDQINLLVYEKYMKDYKYCNENNLKFEDVHTPEAVIQAFLEEGYIEVLKDIDGNDVKDQYYINPEAAHLDTSTLTLKENGTEGNGTKLFKIIKEEEKYNVYFVDKYGELEYLETINFNPEV